MILYPKCRRRRFTVPAVQQLSFITSKIGRAKALLYLQASWNFAPTFHIFTRIWLKLDAGDLYLNTANNFEFHKNGRNENNTSLTGVMDFHIYCPVRVKSHIRQLHVIFWAFENCVKIASGKAILLLRALVKIRLHVRYTVKSLGISKVKHAWVKFAYCIMERVYIICGLVVTQTECLLRGTNCVFEI